MKTWKLTLLTSTGREVLTLGFDISIKKFLEKCLQTEENFSVKLMSKPDSWMRASRREVINACTEDEEDRDAITSFLSTRYHTQIVDFEFKSDVILAICQFLNLNASKPNRVLRKAVFFNDNYIFEIQLFEDRTSLTGSSFQLEPNSQYSFLTVGDYVSLEDSPFRELIKLKRILIQKKLSFVSSFVNNVHLLSTKFNEQDGFNEVVKRLLKDVSIRDFYSSDVDISSCISNFSFFAKFKNFANDEGLNDTSICEKIFDDYLDASESFDDDFKKLLVKVVKKLVCEKPERLGPSDTLKAFLIKIGFKSYCIEIDGFGEIKWQRDHFVYDESLAPFTCSGCRQIHVGLFYESPDGNKFCPECARRFLQMSNRQRCYHSTSIFRPMESIGEKPSEKARYGLELEGKFRNGTSWTDEMLRLAYGNGNLCKVERDGSVSNGEETITQPLNKHFLLSEDVSEDKNFKKFFKEWSNLYKTDRDTGLHVHVDKGVLTNEEWGKLLVVVSKYTGKFASIFRHQKHYCNYERINSIVENYGDQPLLVYQKWSNYPDHYDCISLSHHTNKTVEFRLFDGTDNYDQVMKDLKSLMILLDNVNALYEATDLEVVR